MGILDLCDEFFGERDIYKLLELPKDALPKDIKKAYYKLSLQVHPDRVTDAEKATATEKFKVLSKIYQVLSDKDKRALYDEQGVIEDEDEMEGKINSWLELWRKIFKPLTVEDISNYQKSYVGSELERNDIKRAYLSGKGCINHMMNEVPFLKVEDEPRLQEIVAELIAGDEVPEYKIFTHEPAQKRKRRHKKYARESREAEEIKEKMKAEENGNLIQAIAERQKSREAGFNTLMDKLMEKYGDEDDDDALEFADLGKGKIKTKKIKTPAKKGKARTSTKAGTPKGAGVKTGRVSKRRN